MPLIDKETVFQITDRADIVEVVSDYVNLIRRGANYVGLCPFHNERTPSFSVNRRKNFCYCFSCKQGGSPVNFIMKMEGLSYHEALLHLARRYGIEVRQRELTDEEKRAQTEREAMFIANEWAMNEMRSVLMESEEGKEIGLSYFFSQRGITQEAMNAFKLGYALDKGNDLVQKAISKGFDINVFKKTGLVGTSRDGRDYDRYRGRVIFPILNTSGKVIGFGGRTLKNDKAKYINSPESEIYKKSNELYGIFQARTSIGKEDKCYLVEGYFDVIGMWQSGMKNVVASSGTALTDGQIALIHRFTNNITLIYDGDNAGIKAALRGVDMLLHHKLNVKVLLLPNGEDPDSFARKNTPEDFRKYVEENETDVISFKAKALVKDMESDPQNRITAIQDMVTTLAHISDPIARDVYIQECASVMKVPESTILKAVVTKRNELIENWKRERNIKAISKYSPNKNPTNPNQSDDSANGENRDEIVRYTDNSNSSKTNPTNVNKYESACKQKKDKTAKKHSPLYELEKKLILYSVKYGFIPFCKIDNELEDSKNNISAESSEKKEAQYWNVVEFIHEDMKRDGITFSYPVFIKLIDIILSLKNSFNTARIKKEESLKKEIENLRKKGFEEIAEKNLSLNEIQKEEKILEMKLASQISKEMWDFDKNYVIRILSSYEDDHIRELATELAVERHQLSQIFFRDNNIVETEEDRLYILVPRAINELKNEIITQQVKALFNDLSEATKRGDEELETQLLAEINEKIQQRAGMAKGLGERIVSPSTFA